jgi:hypothetical protein
MTASVCDRFAAVLADAVLTIRPIAVDVGDGVEEYVRLEVDGKPLVALPRPAFLDAFHAAVHEEPDDVA